MADRRHVGHGDPAADDNDDDEDMDDVLHFLANRRGGKHTVTQDPHHQAVAATSATALAFLRSSYSAAPVVAKSAVMRPETAPSKLALAKEVMAIEFLVVYYQHHYPLICLLSLVKCYQHHPLSPDVFFS